MHMKFAAVALALFLAVSRAAASPAEEGAPAPCFGSPLLKFQGLTAPPPSPAVCGLSLIAGAAGPQTAALGRDAFAVCIRDGEDVVVDVPLTGLAPGAVVRAEVALLHGAPARAGFAFDGAPAAVALAEGAPLVLEARLAPDVTEGRLRMTTLAGPGESVVRWRRVRLVQGQDAQPVPVMPAPPETESFPPPVLPPLRPGTERVLLEWDWRMRDGIETEREPVPYALAAARALQQGNALIEHLAGEGAAPDTLLPAWRALEMECEALAGSGAPGDDPAWERLWLRVNEARRRIVFANPLAQEGPLVFAKHTSSFFSHQLTQYYGRLARPGGGLFVLERPGESMACRPLTDGLLPEGSYMQPEVSHDADRILFAYCEAPTVPDWDDVTPYRNRYYRLYEIRPDGIGLRRLTDGPHDDFSPCELPNGQIVFLSTRRGGFHRCGKGPCDVYTLALAEADGANPRTISFHETQEWDPSVLADGRVIYTRWDYVDRNAVHYQQLWVTRPDGTAPAAFYGNNTFSPVGVWEARQVPGSPLIMATAAAHHAMTAGSIVLVDRARGVDGPEPLRRLTPDAPFPESETHVPPVNWHAPGSPASYDTPEAARRWPNHCYRSPYPLSENFFLAAYSYDPLIGEPDSNKANMFGLYLADAFGNRELIYRDLAIASLWPVPLRPRPRPPVIPPMRDEELGDEGLFYLQNVYASNYELPPDSVRRLRIVQVLPKTTPHANNPTVGLANASPGKQVLGTVPVEPDGSAYFRAPARVPLMFQALDEHGRAVQTMRSLTYLQPGEKVSCVGCHEPRLSAPVPAQPALAMRREPSRIAPGPDGSLPFSYPLLVQPVLDAHCVRCHGGEEPAGPEGRPLTLTGDPDGAYSKSYNALAPLVPFASWSDLAANDEPVTRPGRFGACASPLMVMLLAGHQDVRLGAEDMDRLVTWMDANALFYGTFDPEAQARQLRGERIEGPALY
jgi:mono/diheme cytochrome c family protein